MGIDYVTIKNSLSNLSDHELADLRSLIQEEEKSRRRNQKLLSRGEGYYELKEIATGKGKVSHYWYLRYRLKGKLKSKYLGKGCQGDSVPSEKLQNKGNQHLEQTLGSKKN